MKTPFYTTILGSSSALPTAKRSVTGQLVTHGGNHFLIDCGEGVQKQLRMFKQPFNRIDHIFITHMHGDHCLGIPGFISSLSLFKRVNTLNIYGPAKLKLFIERYLECFGEDLSYPLNYVVVDPKSCGTIFKSNSLEISTFPLKHKRKPTVGYLFKEVQKRRGIKKEMVETFNISVSDILKIIDGEDYTTDDGKVIKNEKLMKPAVKGRSFAFCSDTSYSEAIIPYIKGADLIYHETTFTEEDIDIAKKTGHSTAKQAATIASKAEVKKMITGHYSNRYDNLGQLLKEARSIFSESYLVDDGDRFNI